MRPNDFILHTPVDGHIFTNFNLREFLNPEGWALIHPAVVEALERTRLELNQKSWAGIVQIIVTNTTRTRAQNEALAARLGWSDRGGLVAVRSYHLVEFGGIAVDFYARLSRGNSRVPQWQVGQVARKYFDFVKDDYADGHIHGDLRNLIT